jgi:hypothetical protein
MAARQFGTRPEAGVGGTPPHWRHHVRERSRMH